MLKWEVLKGRGVHVTVLQAALSYIIVQAAGFSTPVGMRNRPCHEMHWSHSKRGLCDISQAYQWGSHGAGNLSVKQQLMHVLISQAPFTIGLCEWDSVCLIFAEVRPSCSTRLHPSFLHVACLCQRGARKGMEGYVLGRHDLRKKNWWYMITCLQHCDNSIITAFQLTSFIRFPQNLKQSNKANVDVGKLWLKLSFDSSKWLFCNLEISFRRLQ